MNGQLFDFLLEDRVQKIRQTYESEKLEERGYIAFSGGKDSCVLSVLMDLAIPDNQIPRVYTNTGIEYKLIVDFVHKKMREDERITEIKPSQPIVQILEAFGYPFKSKEHSKKYRLLKEGSKAPSVLNYWNRNGKLNKSFCVPEILEYQRDSNLPFPVSERCCNFLKKAPSKVWAIEHHRPVVITGVRRAEGGHRNHIKGCLAFEHGKVAHFMPLLPLDDDFMKTFIDRYNVWLSDIYLPPYNFTRTGCKGCPFARDLHANLETLQRYFPGERKQCELIFGKVYDEYRRIGYRLKSDKEVLIE